MSAERITMHGRPIAYLDEVQALADAVNQLAMQLGTLACNTPDTERETARTRRRDIRTACDKIREDIAGLIPE